MLTDGNAVLDVEFGLFEACQSVSRHFWDLSRALLHARQLPDLFSFVSAQAVSKVFWVFGDFLIGRETVDQLGELHLLLHEHQVGFRLELALFTLVVCAFDCAPLLLAFLLRTSSLLDLAPKQMLAQQSLLLLLDALDELTGIAAQLHLVIYAFSSHSQSRW